MNQLQILQAIQRCHTEGDQLALEFHAYFKLFTLACEQGDGKLADEHRERMRVLTDKMWDTVATSATLKRQLLMQPPDLD